MLDGPRQRTIVLDQTGLMGTTNDLDRMARREQLVIEHMQSENVQDWDRTMATFSRARYELPDGRIIDGADAVLRYWVEGRKQVPDQRNELVELTHIDETHVQIRFWLRGTPTTTQEPFAALLWAVYDFDDLDLMTNERVYTSPPTDAQIEGRVTTAGLPTGAT